MFDSMTPAANRLRAAVEARMQAEIAEAVAIADLAAEYTWDAGDAFDVVATRPIRLGADGTALVNEFLPLEIAALKRISVAAATWLIRDIVNLKARHPLLWRRVLAGGIPVFRATQLAAEAARCDLTLDQALELDAELACRVGVLPWPRVLRLARGLIATIAADKVATFAEQARMARYVRKHPTDDPMVGFLTARVDTADAIFFDAAVDRIADVLGARGDTDPKEIRRAKAVGILATPARASLMLTEAADGDIEPEPGAVRSTDPRLLPQATVYVHVAEETLLTGRGAADVEGVGGVPAAMLRILLGHTRVRLTPVVRPYANVAVDEYEIPSRIRQQVLLRNRFEVFPYSGRSSRRQDLDHTVPFSPGRSGQAQTRASNLGPLSRKAHRAKTHGGWLLEQPRPGVFHWTTPSGDRYRVTPDGTNWISDDPILESLWRNDLDPPDTA